MRSRPIPELAACCLALAVATFAVAQERTAPPVDFSRFQPWTKDAV